MSRCSSFRNSLRVTALATALVLSSCSGQSPKTPARFWCEQTPLQETSLTVYAQIPKPKQGEDSTVHSIIDTANIFGGTTPLAVACSDNGYVWWVTDQFVYFGELSSSPTCCDLTLSQKIVYYTVPELTTPPARILAADIWLPAGEQVPSIAVITSTGWFQYFKVQLARGRIDEKLTYSIWEPTGTDSIEFTDVQGATISLLSAANNQGEVAIIPHGPDVHSHFYFAWNGTLNEFTPDLWKLDIRKTTSAFDYITGSAPSYDEHRDPSGSVATIYGFDTNGAPTETWRVLRPRDVLTKMEKQPSGD